MVHCSKGSPFLLIGLSYPKVISGTDDNECQTCLGNDKNIFFILLKFYMLLNWLDWPFYMHFVIFN